MAYYYEILYLNYKNIKKTDISQKEEKKEIRRKLLDGAILTQTDIDFLLKIMANIDKIKDKILSNKTITYNDIDVLLKII